MMQPTNISPVFETGEVAKESAGALMQEFGKETPLGATLHKMSQNVTVLLNLLELAQLTGEVEPGDVSTMLEAAHQLQTYIKVLRSNNAVIGSAGQ